MIPYTRHSVSVHDVQSIEAALYDGDLATGVRTDQYERAFAQHHGFEYGVAVNSGTSALYCALRVRFGSAHGEIITSPLTFCATANMIHMVGAIPVFADVDAQSWNLTNRTIGAVETCDTLGVVPVDYGGMHCQVNTRCGMVVDAAHSVGLPGGVGDLRCYSTHAAKNMTTCEGGMVLTNDRPVWVELKALRSHGINSHYATRVRYEYEMAEPSFNFRMPDPLAAMGVSQLNRLEENNRRRGEIVHQYQCGFLGVPGIILRNYNAPSSHHLYVVLLDLERLQHDRDWHFDRLREVGVGVNVHYKPVYLFRWYRDHYGYEPGLCPNAEWVWERMLTLPLFPTMTDEQVREVVGKVTRTVTEDLA